MNMTNGTNYQVVLAKVCSIHYKHPTPTSHQTAALQISRHVRDLTVIFRFYSL
jgi:hypothetical protein